MRENVYKIVEMEPMPWMTRCDPDPFGVELYRRQCYAILIMQDFIFKEVDPDVEHLSLFIGNNNLDGCGAIMMEHFCFTDSARAFIETPSTAFADDFKIAREAVSDDIEVLVMRAIAQKRKKIRIRILVAGLNPDVRNLIGYPNNIILEYLTRYNWQEPMEIDAAILIINSSALPNTRYDPRGNISEAIIGDSNIESIAGTVWIESNETMSVTKQLWHIYEEMIRFNKMVDNTFSDHMGYIPTRWFHAAKESIVEDIDRFVMGDSNDKFYSTEPWSNGFWLHLSLMEGGSLAFVTNTKFIEDLFVAFYNKPEAVVDIIRSSMSPPMTFDEIDYLRNVFVSIKNDFSAGWLVDGVTLEATNPKWPHGLRLIFPGSDSPSKMEFIRKTAKGTRLRLDKVLVCVASIKPSHCHKDMMAVLPNSLDAPIVIVANTETKDVMIQVASGYWFDCGPVARINGGHGDSYFGQFKMTEENIIYK